MSFVNPIDYTGFSSPFRADLVANNRNMAEAKKKAGNYLRAGKMGGFGASQFGQAVSQGFLDDAQAYANQQAQNASRFGNIANLAGSIGGFAAMGGFSGGGPGKMATLDSTPMTVENAYGSSVSYYDPNIYTDVGDVSSGHVFSPTSSWMTGS